MSEPEQHLSADLEHILKHTGQLWESFRGQNIFLTGGTGFFGSWLLESFTYANRTLDLKSKIVVLTRQPDAFRLKAPHLANDPAIRLVAGDVRTFSARDVRSQVGSSGPDNYIAVIHAATEASAKLNTENPLLMLDTIVQGTRAALDFAVEVKARDFLLTSSGAVYGTQPSELTHIPEIFSGAPDCAKPQSAYGEGKRVAELLCAIYSDRFGLRTKIARCFAFVGPHLPMNAHFAVGNFIRDGLSGDPIRVNGDGTPYRSYLYAADLTIWLWTILLKGESQRPYNVGSGRDLTIAAIAGIVSAVLSDGRAIEIAQKAVPGKLVERYVPCVKRAQQELKLSEWVSLEEAIGKTANWNRKAIVKSAKVG